MIVLLSLGSWRWLRRPEREKKPLLERRGFFPKRRGRCADPATGVYDCGTNTFVGRSRGRSFLAAISRARLFHSLSSGEIKGGRESGGVSFSALLVQAWTSSLSVSGILVPFKVLESH